MIDRGLIHVELTGVEKSEAIRRSGSGSTRRAYMRDAIVRYWQSDFAWSDEISKVAQELIGEAGALFSVPPIPRRRKQKSSGIVLMIGDKSHSLTIRMEVT